MRNFKFLTINAVLLMVIAAILEMTLHELGHYVSAYYFHASNLSLHHNYVDFDDKSLSDIQNLCVAAAGPLTSLCIGILFHLITNKQTSRNFLFLFNTYFAAHGYIGFFGYLMIAPIAAQGDTGYIMKQLHVPLFITIAIALFALVILRKLILILTRHILEMATSEIYHDTLLRKKYVQAVFIYPVYMGLVLIIILNLPVPIWISLMAPFSIFSFFYAYGEAMSKMYNNMHFNPNEMDLLRFKPIIIILLVFIIIINRLLV